MSGKMLFFVLTGLGVALEIIGDIFIKKWSVDDRTVWLIVGFAIYLVGSVFWVFSLKQESLSKAITVFTLLNLIGIVLVGLFLFHEKLSTRQFVGIALGVVAIFLIEL